MSDTGGASRTGDTGELLRLHLSLTVPLCLAELRAKGGPTYADAQRVRTFGKELAEHGDELLYRGKPGRAAELVTSLADALAVLAYQPGGVRFLGMHFEEEAEERDGADLLAAWLAERQADTDKSPGH